MCSKNRIRGIKRILSTSSVLNAPNEKERIVLGERLLEYSNPVQKYAFMMYSFKKMIFHVFYPFLSEFIFEIYI